MDSLTFRPETKQLLAWLFRLEEEKTMHDLCGGVWQADKIDGGQVVIKMDEDQNVIEVKIFTPEAILDYADYEAVTPDRPAGTFREHAEHTSLCFDLSMLDTMILMVEAILDR